ncbi:MAG: hypothetical protein LBU41_06030 [Clostridiales Family XIII bacterium]|jgi:hypothetical protein|nr:hypothetical protein [Clostridiales Family XIII bacterium]
MKQRLSLFFILVCLISLTAFSGCGAIQKISDRLLHEAPTEKDTITTEKLLADAVVAALQDGEEEVTLNIAMEEEEIAKISSYMTPFWGRASKYTILSEYKDLDLGSTTEPIVYKVHFTLEHSINYYVYNAYKDPNFEIPENQPDTQAVLAALKNVIGEIYRNRPADVVPTDYEETLAAHDWLVRNLTYDESLSEGSKENGVVGAFLNRKTMCQGYSEALQLILLCATNVKSDIIVGNALNSHGESIGHAWNIVLINGNWYHVDATFDDPVGNPEDSVNHYYFGQTDEVMITNHEWNTEIWPQANAEDFLFFRASGLYADGQDAFVSIVRDLILSDPSHIAIAVTGPPFFDDQFQFIYRENPDVTNLYRGLTTVGPATIVTLNLTYRS